MAAVVGLEVGVRGVGAVGARLWFPNKTLQHAGVILGVGGIAAHSHRRMPAGREGYAGRAALIQWARLHTGAVGAISPRRCIALADDGHAGWRLWQLVRAECSLREAIDGALRDHPGDSLLPRLCQLAQQLLDADGRLARLALPLPCNLDCIGISEGAAVYIGLMPDPSSATAGPRPPSDPRALVSAQLEPIAAALRDRAFGLEHVLAGLDGGAAAATATTASSVASPPP